MGKMVRGEVEKGMMVKGGGNEMEEGIKIERGNIGEMREYMEEEEEDIV